MTCSCGKSVEAERAALGLTRCIQCAKTAPETERKGLMIYTGKSDSELCLLTPRQLKTISKKSGKGLSGRCPC